MVALALSLMAPAPAGGEALAQTPSVVPADPACAAADDDRVLTYRNSRWGFAMDYPASFAFDPDSVPENRDSARFWTADRRSTAVVTGLRNGAGQSLVDLFREAERDILENSGGSITYRRVTPQWFVLSGYVAYRIYYRRTFLARGGQVIATLWIDFPRGLRTCFEAAVTRMSLSFRRSGP